MFVDSVFSPLLAKFAQEEEKTPYPDDEPILERDEIEKSLDDRENQAANLLTAVGWSATDDWLKRIDPALKSGDKDFINKNPWSLPPTFQGLIFGLWNNTWDIGTNHATRELNITLEKARQDKASFSKANFAEDVFIAYPPDYGLPLRDTDLKSAVEQRTLYLARDIEQKTRDRIQGYVVDAVNTHGTDGVPPKERSRLVQRINLAIGRQSKEEISDPEVLVGEQLVRTKLQIPGTQTFASRAKTIARTELSAAYSLGRLQVYVQAGVKKVRWVTHLRSTTCRICRSRNGLILDIDDVLAQHKSNYKTSGFAPSQFAIPVHPRCRCHLAPILEDIDKDHRKMARSKGRDPNQRKISPVRTTWNALGALGSALSLLQSAQTTVQTANRALQRQQEEQERQRQQKMNQLVRTAFLTGGAALSVGLLYLLMRNQQQRRPGSQSGGVVPTQPLGPGPQPVGGGLLQALTPDRPTTLARVASEVSRQQAIEQIEAQPVTPNMVLPEELKQKYPRLLNSGIDLKAITRQGLSTIYGLTTAEAQMVLALLKKYQASQIIPPERALVPQNLLPQNVLAQYPQLGQVPDVRNLTIDALLKLGLGQAQASRVSDFISRQIQSALALPPARTQGGLMAGDVNLASATPSQIAGLLTHLSPAKRQSTANAIYNYIRDRTSQGQPIATLDDLINVPGVGAVTVRNLKAKNFTQNINNLLLQVDDISGADAIAAQLGVGPKMAREVVRDFRENGQFGATGIDPAEDLIDRVERRISRPGSNLVLTDEAKDRIRTALAGQLYLMPVPKVQPQVQQQTVSTSGILPSATSPLGVPSPLNPVTPQLPPRTPRDQPSAPSPGLITPPPGQLPFYTPPALPTPGVRGQQVRRQRWEYRQAYDRARAARESLQNKANTYQAEVRQTVNASTARSVKGKALGDKANELLKKQEKIVEAAIRTTTSVAMTEDRMDTTLAEVELQVRQAETAIEDIDDPLAPDLFTKDGNRKPDIDVKVVEATKNINRALRQVESALSAPSGQVRSMQLLKDQLTTLRDRIQDELQNLPSDSPLRQQQGALIRDIEIELSSLQNITPQQSGDYYPEIQNTVEQIRGILDGVANDDRNELIQSIDGRIAVLDDQIDRIRNLQVQDVLVQAREDLLNKKARLQAIPKTRDTLTPEQAQAYNVASEQRTRINQSNRELQRVLKVYRDRTTERMQELIVRSDQFNDVMADWITPGETEGTRLYDERRQSSLKSLEDILNERYTEIGRTIDGLKIVSEPSTGISYVMQNIAPIGKRDALAKPEQLPRGLDDAIEIRRNTIQILKNRITYKPNEGERSQPGFTEKIEGLLDYDNPRQLTQQQLSAVQDELRFWVNKQDAYLNQLDVDATRIQAELELLREIDPIAYGLARGDAIQSSLFYDRRLMEREFEARISQLNEYRTRLQQDLDREPVYVIQGQPKTPTQIREDMVKARSEINQISSRRRGQLESVLVKATQRGISMVELQDTTLNNPVALAENFTPSEIEIIREAVADGQNGAFQVYRELAVLSREFKELTKQKEAQWQKIQEVCAEIERKYGYRIVVRELPNREVEISEPVDIEPNPDRFVRGRKSPESQIARLRNLLGIAPDEVFNPTQRKGKYADIPPDLTKQGRGRLKTDSYFGILQKIEANEAKRIEVDRRLEVLNFNRDRRLVRFRQNQSLVGFSKRLNRERAVLVFPRYRIR